MEYRVLFVLLAGSLLSCALSVPLERAKRDRDVREILATIYADYPGLEGKISEGQFYIVIGVRVNR